MGMYEKTLGNLLKNKFIIHPKTNNKIIIAYKVASSVVVCTFDNKQIMVSVSFGGLPNLPKAKELVGKIFGRGYRHYSACEFDGVRANYFKNEDLGAKND